MSEPANEYQYPGKKNFRGPSGSKSGEGVKPKASGSPWTGGRASQSEGKDYSKDYSRKGSDYGSGATGPKKPSAERATPLYKGNKDREGI